MSSHRSDRRELVVRALAGSGSLWEVISQTLDLPIPSLFGLLGANPYGIDVGKLVHLRDTLVPESIMKLTLADIIGGAISDDEAVRGRYLGWIEKAKAELAPSSSSHGKAEAAIKGAAALRKELSAVKKNNGEGEVKRSAALVEELKATGKKLEADARSATSIRLKWPKGKKPAPIEAGTTTIAEILSELLGRLGITDHVAYLSALAHHAEETRSVFKEGQNSAATNAPNSLGELAAQTTSGPSLLSLLSKGVYLMKNAMIGGARSARSARGARGGSSDKCTTVMGVVVCDSAAEGEGIPDGPSFARRYVIHADPMTLERGPGFRVDAFDVLDKSLATFEIATTSLLKDKNASREYVSLLLDALADAFRMHDSAHKSHGGGRGGGGPGGNKRGGGGSRMVKITTTTGGCAMCAEEHVARLEKLGIAQKGGKDRIVYVQQQPSAQQQQMNQQYLKNDTYSSSAIGCIAGIACCELCLECGDYAMIVADS